jgi:8-oxo-dGTP diphosphatase
MVLKLTAKDLNSGFNTLSKKGWQMYYDKLGVTVDIVIFSIKNDDLNVLLVKRKLQPFKDMWAIPGGFVRKNESLKKAAMRKLLEETGVKDVYLEQLYTFGEPKRDPRGRIITIAYFALIDSTKIKPIARTDVYETGWHSMYDIPKKLAFDHEDILKYAFQRLRYKLEYTTVGFQLLPKKFTLSELQKVYEIILSKELDKRNFRKKIASLNLLKALNENKMEGAHRPARLYSFKEKKYIFPRGVI